MAIVPREYPNSDHPYLHGFSPVILDNSAFFGAAAVLWLQLGGWQLGEWPNVVGRGWLRGWVVDSPADSRT